MSPNVGLERAAAWHDQQSAHPNCRLFESFHRDCAVSIRALKVPDPELTRPDNGRRGGWKGQP